MKHFLVVALAAGALAACGSPEPIRFGDLEQMDSRFTPPAAHASGVEDLVRKDELTLEDVLALADRMNPELARERKNVDLATASVWEAQLYPNPSLLLQVEDVRTRNSFGDSKRLAGISFSLALGGRLGAGRSVAEKEREAAAIGFVWRRREILSLVKRAFASLLVSNRTVELARETRDLAKTLHDVTNERFKAQAVPEMELLKAAVSLAKAEVDLRLAEKDVLVGRKSLHALMGNADLPQEKFSGTLYSRFTLPGFEALRGQVTSVHPLLETAVRKKEAAELELVLARRERVPDVGLDVLGGRDSNSQTIVEAGISIPLPLFNRNQAKIAKAEIRIDQAKYDVDAVRNELILRLTESYRSFASAQDRVTVYQEEILPKAEKAFGQTNEGYKLGKFGYLDLLDAQRTLAEARIAFAAALGDLNLSALELEKLTGTRLEPIR